MALSPTSLLSLLAGKIRLDLPFLQRFAGAIEVRLKSLEEQRSNLDTVIEQVRQLALFRINEVLSPAIQSVLEIQSKGFLIARSSTEAELGDGNILTFVVQDEAERDLFTPSPFTLVSREANADDYGVARSISYDRETGEYLCEILTFEGDAGPHDDWVIAAVAGSTMAQIVMLDQALDARDQVEADRAAIVADNLATANAVEADRAEIATNRAATETARDLTLTARDLAAGFASAPEDTPVTGGLFSALHWAAKAAASAAAAATWNPASYYTSVAVDALLTALSDSVDAALAAFGATLPGSFSAVAEGAIAANSFVAMNEDGTVSQVAATGNAPILEASASSWGVTVNGSFSSVHLAVNNDNAIAAYCRQSDGYVALKRGTIAVDGAITYGSEVVVKSASHYRLLAASNSNDETCLVYIGNTGLIEAVKVTAGAVSAALTVFASGNEISQLIDIGSHQFILFYAEASGTLKARVIDVSGGTPTQGTAVTVDTPGMAASMALVGAAWSSAAGYGLVFYALANQTEAYARKITVSGTTITVSAGRETVAPAIGSAAINTLAVTVDGSDFIFYWGRSNNPTNQTEKSWAVAGNWPAATMVIGTVAVSPAYHGEINSKTFRSPVGGVIPLMNSNAISGILLVGGQAVFADVFGNNSGAATIGSVFGAAYSASRAKWLVVAGGNNPYTQRFTPSTYRGNVRKFIGFVVGAAADGASVTVKTIGSVMGGLSGLAPGREYHVNADGTLRVKNPGATRLYPPMVTSQPMLTATSATSAVVKQTGDWEV